MGEVHDMSYYQKCMMGGILSCGITHTMVCPLDIVKCRMQVSTTTAGMGKERAAMAKDRTQTDGALWDLKTTFFYYVITN